MPLWIDHFNQVNSKLKTLGNLEVSTILKSVLLILGTCSLLLEGTDKSGSLIKPEIKSPGQSVVIVVEKSHPSINEKTMRFLSKLNSL